MNRDRNIHDEVSAEELADTRAAIKACNADLARLDTACRHVGHEFPSDALSQSHHDQWPGIPLERVFPRLELVGGRDVR